MKTLLKVKPPNGRGSAYKETAEDRGFKVETLGFL